MIADEEVIRRRLLLDGDGMGDDRRLSVLLKTFIKWCQMESDGAEIRLIYERMLMQLAQCEFTMVKSQLACKMNETEMQNYESLLGSVALQIEEAKKEIENTKVDLQKARQIRKHRMEYDQLAKVIAEQPDRRLMECHLSQLQKCLTDLKCNEKQLDAKLELRRKQFHALDVLIHQLQNTVTDELIMPTPIEVHTINT